MSHISTGEGRQGGEGACSRAAVIESRGPEATRIITASHSLPVRTSPTATASGRQAGKSLAG